MTEVRIYFVLHNACQLSFSVTAANFLDISRLYLVKWSDPRLPTNRHDQFLQESPWTASCTAAFNQEIELRFAEAAGNSTKVNSKLRWSMKLSSTKHNTRSGQQQKRSCFPRPTTMGPAVGDLHQRKKSIACRIQPRLGSSRRYPPYRGCHSSRRFT